MQPKIISRDKLFITGLTGGGSKTGEVWGEFDRQYKINSFPKADKSAYEIRFHAGTREAVSGQDVHVGHQTEAVIKADGFTSIELPAAEYAVFDVYVARGYDSENDAMDEWLAMHSAEYGQLELDGRRFAVECYNERFKGGSEPDSVVEIWIPLFRYCQSCYMPMTKSDDFGTEADGSPSRDYCCHCYQNGDFTWKPGFEEFVEDNIRFWRDDCSTDDEARARIMEVFPKLKRWAEV